VPVVTVECELGFSATNRMKTVTKSRRNPAIEKVACKIDAHLLTLYCAPAKDFDFEQIKEQWIADSPCTLGSSWVTVKRASFPAGCTECATIGSVRVRNTRL